MVEITRSFEIEVDTIDTDHRSLLGIINEIVRAIDAGAPGKCTELVPKFVNLAKQHFRREEALLEEHDYPEIDKHRKHHAGLDDKMQTMLELAERVVESPPACEDLRKEMIYFLMDDVINEDMDFKSFLVDATTEGG